MYDIKYDHERNYYSVHGMKGMYFNIPSDAMVYEKEVVVDVELPFCNISFWKNNKIVHMTMYPVGYRD
jgi:hypothetical protein